ncbi:MAG: hypothetical protein HC771_07810 [Synechococcales cyanobacterium CRU_2_2]|nr:hypothetical protein [Synechococcales cyanobacterium CRU_2_2]
MATRSSVRLGRLSDRAITPQRQLITFRLRRTGFFLPLQWVYRAMVFDAQDIRQNQVSFEQYNLPLVNVGQIIFGDADPVRRPSALIGLVLQQPSQQAPRPSSLEQPPLEQLENAPQLVLPIDSAPALCRVSDSSFVPLPHTYAVQCVAEMTDNSSDYPLHLLLNPQQLFAQLLTHSSAQPLASALSSR